MQAETYFNNAKKRDRSLQVIYKLLDRINTNIDHVWEDYGLADRDMRTTFVDYIVSFILDFNIDNNYCLFEDINEYIFKLLKFLNVPVSSEKNCQKLTNYILTTVLKNSGESIAIPQYDHEEKQMKQININFIQSIPLKEEDAYSISQKEILESIAFSEHTRRKSYNLSEEGYDMMFSTYEYREKVMDLTASMDIHNFILSFQVEHRDYDGAGKELRQIRSKIAEKKKEIQSDIYAIRRDPSIYQKKYINEVDEIIKCINKFIKDNQQMQKRINNDLEDFERINNDNDEKYNELLNVKSENANVWNELNKLQTLFEKLKEVARRASLSQMENHNISHFNLREVIYQSILKKPSSLQNMITILNPLFFHQPHAQILNPNILLYPPRHKGPQTEKIVQKIEDVNIEQEKLNQRRRYMEEYRALKNVIETIFTFAVKEYKKGKKTISIQNLYQHTLSSKKFKTQLLSNEKAFIHVLFKLSRMNEKINIRQEKTKSMFESSDISIIPIIQEVFCKEHERDSGWKNIQQLTIRYGSPNNIYTFESREHYIEVTDFYLILNH